MRILIIGAGIAGPVLGAFLARAGFEVMLREARHAPVGDEGGFLGLAPSGVHVLTELGLRAPIEALGAPCDGFSFLNSAGREIGVIDRRGDEASHGARLIMVRRADLQRVVLEEALRRGVDVRHERRLAELDRSRSDCVEARFEDGSTTRADVVVGCDGLRSRVRSILFPESPPPAYSGLLDFGGYARLENPPLPVGWNVMVFGQRAFFGAFRRSAASSSSLAGAGDGGRERPGGEEVWWFHNGGASSPLRSLAPEERRQRILDSHAKDPSWIGDCVRATPEILGPWALHEVADLPRWHVGPVGVIGDAAHATSPSGGLGASLALEDALLLARCLRDEPDAERAFSALERLRKPRVEDAVRQSRRNASAKAMPGPIAARLRDLVLPLFFRLGRRAQDRAYSYRVSWEGS